MKATQTLGIILLLSFFQSSLIHSQNLSNMTLIAHYPLINTANDTTGNYAPMTLTNAPFQDGGIYCDGISGSSYVITPTITDLNFAGLAISAEFKVSSYITSGFNPVLIGGYGYQWMGIGLSPDSLVSYIFNGSTVQNTNVKFSLETWHIATMTYDSSKGIGKFYIDSILADSAQLQIDAVDDEYIRKIAPMHAGYGEVFKGVFRNLKIYNKNNETEVKSNKVEILNQFQLRQNYPNPFNPETTIEYQLPQSSEVKLTIYDIRGQLIREFIQRTESAGSYQVIWNGQDQSGHTVSTGIYFFQIETKSKDKHFIDVKKMVFIK